MKKILMILAVSFAFASCGDGTNRSEANRDAEENYENKAVEPGVNDDGSNTRMQGDTTLQDNTMLNDRQPGNQILQPSDTIPR